MIEDLRNFLRKFSCNHKWVRESEERFSNGYGDIHYSYLYKCTECGDFKKIKLK